jgi:hypothetical protein
MGDHVNWIGARLIRPAKQAVVGDAAKPEGDEK